MEDVFNSFSCCPFFRHQSSAFPPKGRASVGSGHRRPARTHANDQVGGVSHADGDENSGASRLSGGESGEARALGRRSRVLQQGGCATVGIESTTHSDPPATIPDRVERRRLRPQSPGPGRFPRLVVVDARRQWTVHATTHRGTRTSTLLQSLTPVHPPQNTHQRCGRPTPSLCCIGAHHRIRSHRVDAKRPRRIHHLENMRTLGILGAFGDRIPG